MKNINFQNTKTRLLFGGIPLILWLSSVILIQFIQNKYINYYVIFSSILLVITYITLIISDHRNKYYIDNKIQK